ncbi:hypothetical protein [Streptomyces klenkii]
MTRYIATGSAPADVHGAPDYARGGWQVAAISDLEPGPIGMVSVAITAEKGHEQCDVVLVAKGGMRVRAQHRVAHWPPEGDGEIPEVTTEGAGLEGVDILRISAYGDWARMGLAAALREAAEMLEAAEGLNAS